MAIDEFTFDREIYRPEHERGHPTVEYTVKLVAVEYDESHPIYGDPVVRWEIVTEISKELYPYRYDEKKYALADWRIYINGELVLEEFEDEDSQYPSRGDTTHRHGWSINNPDAGPGDTFTLEYDLEEFNERGCPNGAFGGYNDQCNNRRGTVQTLTGTIPDGRLEPVREENLLVSCGVRDIDREEKVGGTVTLYPTINNQNRANSVDVEIFYQLGDATYTQTKTVPAAGEISPAVEFEMTEAGTFTPAIEVTII